MEDKRLEIIKHIKLRSEALKVLGKEYSDEKINTLADKLLATNKSLEDIKNIIDNKFSNETRKITHNNHLASLKEYYLSSISKLKKGNNVYLLSYQKGNKVLEQALLEQKKELSPFLKLVNINHKKAYYKENDLNNDFELIMSDIAYLVNIPYAKTYRVFDEKMNASGIVNESFENENERFLNMEETLRFIKEESPKFNLKSEIQEYHDQNIKHGLKRIPNKKAYINNIEYVLKVFKSLPDITDKNYNELKQNYLKMKIFELLTNSLNNNLSNFGIIVDKKELKYTYRLSPAYNKCVTNLPTLKPNETICNFFIVDKRILLSIIINNYYDDVKYLANIIVDNQDTLLPLIDQVIKEHLEYEQYNTYYEAINDNFDIIIEEVLLRKTIVKDKEEDKEKFEDENVNYNNRIAPFIDNCIMDEDKDEKGSSALVAVVAIVLFITALLFLLAIYSIIKMDM